MPVTPFALVFVSLRRSPPFRVLISIAFYLAVGHPQWPPRRRPLFQGPETDRCPSTSLRNRMRLSDAVLPLRTCSRTVGVLRALQQPRIGFRNDGH